jgi:hypothetical protein
MKAIIVVELNLDDEDFNVASDHLFDAVQAIRKVKTEQMTDDIIVSIDDSARHVLAYLKEDTGQS